MTATVFTMAMAIMAATGQGALAADVPAAFSPSDAMNIARKNACMGCHAVDRKLVGPSFQQIAIKYKGDAQAQARLETKVRDGGSGVWGVLPMPSHRSMNGADIKTVVGWILAGSPSK
ncbi:cytochrome C [Caballeronia sp. LjRoot34]|uniref:c-type cytochrome n=1 Tax=Caballeronia sp. LjRoot34 TaxID=3342325 RepID=UPI003ECE2ABE